MENAATNITMLFYDKCIKVWRRHRANDVDYRFEGFNALNQRDIDSEILKYMLTLIGTLCLT